MSAFEIAGYAQGFRFNAASYENGAFIDLSGYGDDLRTLNGSPSFASPDGHEGLILDNTWHGVFRHPNSWDGTVVLVARLERNTSGTLTRQIVTFGGNGASGNNGKLQAIFFGGDRRIQMSSTGARKAGHESIPDGQIGTVAVCQDQLRRTTYSTKDGIGLKTGTTDTGTVNGLANAMGTNAEGAFLGALTGDTGNTLADTSVNIHIFELHFFERNPMIDQPAALQGFLSELTATYG